jgi:hypothetical protein
MTVSNSVSDEFTASFFKVEMNLKDGCSSLLLMLFCDALQVKVRNYSGQQGFG